jgi:O-antigen ligase
MSIIALGSLFAYLVTLALTQTSYGGVFMSARWFMLFALLAATGLYWGSRWAATRPDKKGALMVLAYLIASFLSVIVAENLLYSGLRWISLAVVLLSLLIFLRQSLGARQVYTVFLFLKLAIAGLILVSWLNPLPPIVLTNSQLYRGAFGSSNAMGQVAAVGALLYLHGFMTAKVRWQQVCQLLFTCVALWLTWSSGARSAMVAFLAGICLMNYFYRGKMQRRTFIAVACVALLAFMFPEMPAKAKQFVLRIDRPGRSLTEEVLKTRISIWESAWSSFQKRPLLGWGFGADDTMTKDWQPQLKSLGTIQRDNVNDTLVVLEGSGIVGLLAYALLVLFALGQGPTRRERHLLVRIHAPPSIAKGFDGALYHTHAITFIVSASLLLMVQLDNTALSAGNFISVTIWVCVALSGALRSKAAHNEIVHQRYQSVLQQRIRAGVEPSGLVAPPLRAR